MDGATDPASLENLHDIIAPGPVPWWPPAPGWYVVGMVVTVAVCVLLFRAICTWWANRYRTEALALLDQLRELSRDAAQRPAVIAQLDELLKRAALAAWPRETVANLSGQRWLDFLNQTGGTKTFPQDVSRVLCDIAYCQRLSQQLTPTQVEELFTAASDWIATHRSLPPGSEGTLEGNR